MWFVIAALAAGMEVDVAPSEAVVFANQARVTRRASVTVRRGEDEVVFVDLPAGVVSGSVTAEVSGNAELLGIDLRQVTAREIADVRVAELAEEIASLRDEQQDRQDEIAAAQARLGSATAGREAAAAQLSVQMLVAPGGAATARALMASLSAEDAAAREQERVAGIAARQVRERIAALERERRTLGSSSTNRYRATVRLHAAAAGPVTVALTYGVRGATWRPRYDLRGDPSTGEVTLALSGVVSQATGEDWDDVTLSVSSARPGRGTDVPTLDPFWLRIPLPPPSRRSESLGMVMEAAPMMADAEMDGRAASPPPMDVAQAAVVRELAATTFSVTTAEDIPSDGTERKVLLTTQALTSELRYVVAPRLDLAAYLVGEVTNTADFALLPGEAGVFLDGDYVGKTWLDAVPTGEDFDVSFGPDAAVTVSRSRGETSTGDAGPVGRRQRAQWSWTVDVASSRPAPIAVEVREQVPLSARDDVSVDWSVEDGPDPEEEDGGVLSFSLSVPARGRAAMTWGYVVTYPGDTTMGWME